MAPKNIYSMLLEGRGGSPLFALLLDPDKYSPAGIKKISSKCADSGVDLILLGGSIVLSSVSEAIKSIRNSCTVPIVLFPGNPLQFVPEADAILLLSLISGRNPEYLIGNHVQIATAINESGMEVIPTGYMLVDGGVPTSVQYVSNTMPIPSQKNEIARATALAGQLLGLKTLYLEAGSGATKPVPTSMIEEVVAVTSIPVVVGGGIRTPQQVSNARNAGASMVVVGNAIEVNPKELSILVEACKK